MFSQSVIFSTLRSYCNVQQLRHDPELRAISRLALVVGSACIVSYLWRLEHRTIGSFSDIIRMLEAMLCVPQSWLAGAIL